MIRWTINKLLDLDYWLNKTIDRFFDWIARTFGITIIFIFPIIAFIFGILLGICI